MTPDEKDLIASKLDVTEFLDILGLELIDIMDKFDDELNEAREELLRACN